MLVHRMPEGGEGVIQAPLVAQPSIPALRDAGARLRPYHRGGPPRARAEIPRQ